MAARTPRIAIVDDEPQVRRALQRLLSAEGYDVRLFATGNEFLCNLSGIDCVILDLHMPGMGGFEIHETLLAQHSTLPVVILTGNETSANRARSMANGARAFLVKPVNDTTLLDALRPLALATGGESMSESVSGHRNWPH